MSQSYRTLSTPLRQALTPTIRSTSRRSATLFPPTHPTTSSFLPSASSSRSTSSSAPTRTTTTTVHAPGSSPASGLGTTTPTAEEMQKVREMMHDRQKRMYRDRGERSKNAMYYGAGSLILAFGVTYASVPLYRAFCGATGFGGVPVTDSSKYTPDRLYPDDDDPSDPSGVRTGAGGDERRITVHFEATSSDDLKWKFTPQQRFVRVRPGETALAFYQAHNWGTEDVVGIATYNITPSRVSPYFAKVECFCFEQQKIRAGEQVDLPVFFFVDKDIREDPSAGQVDDMVLSYTFFKARRNEQGHLEPDAPADVVEKSLGFEDYELAEKSTAAL